MSAQREKKKGSFYRSVLSVGDNGITDAASCCLLSVLCFLFLHPLCLLSFRLVQHHSIFSLHKPLSCTLLFLLPFTWPQRMQGHKPRLSPPVLSAVPHDTPTSDKNPARSCKWFTRPRFVLSTPSSRCPPPGVFSLQPEGWVPVLPVCWEWTVLFVWSCPHTALTCEEYLCWV